MRRTKMKNKWQTDLSLITDRQSAKYEDAIEVLRVMRKGTSFSKAAKAVRISPSTAKKYLGNSITKKNGKLVPKKTDNLLRQVRIYENGKEILIQVRGSNNVKKVAQYHSAIGQRIDKNDKTALESFRGTVIKDNTGKYHKLETDLEKILGILQRKEEPPFFTIYRGVR